MSSVIQRHGLKNPYLLKQEENRNVPTKKRKTKPQEINVNKFVSVPLQMIQQIFSLLDARDVSVCLTVCRHWQTIANHNSLWKNLLPPFNGFDKEQWVKHFGDIGAA